MTTKAVTVPSKRTSRTPVTAPSATVMVVDPVDNITIKQDFVESDLQLTKSVDLVT